MGFAVEHRLLGDILAATGDHTAASELYRTGLEAIEPLL